jgi:hypothetical protein
LEKVRMTSTLAFPAPARARRRRPRGDVFGIGLVDHQQHVAGQPAVEPGELGARQEAAGGIVGVGEEHQPRALAHRAEQRVDVGAVVGVGDLDRGRAAATRGDLVSEKP